MEEELRDNPPREIELDISQGEQEEGIDNEPSKEKEDNNFQDEPSAKIKDEAADDRDDLSKAIKKETDLTQDLGDNDSRDGSSFKIKEERTDNDSSQTAEEQKSPNPLDASLSNTKDSIEESDRHEDRPRSLNVAPVHDISQNPESRSEFFAYDVPCWEEMTRAVKVKLSEDMVENELRNLETRFPYTLTSSEILQCCYRLCVQNAVFPPILRLKKKNYVKVEESYAKYMKKVKNKEKDYYLLHLISSTMLANAEVGSREYCLAFSIRGQVLLDDKKYMYALVDLNRALKCDSLSQKTREDIEKHRHTCIAKIRLSKNEKLWVSALQ